MNEGGRTRERRFRSSLSLSFLSFPFPPLSLETRRGARRTLLAAAAAPQKIVTMFFFLYTDESCCCRCVLFFLQDFQNVIQTLKASPLGERALPLSTVSAP